VWEHNKKAIQFYERWGFKDINKSYTFYVGGTIDTDRWMVKFIEKS
jgi:ribosomal protein S18 acetylase RimI-like enzyme